jgi:hypothetical protein
VHYGPCKRERDFDWSNVTRSPGGTVYRDVRRFKRKCDYCYKMVERDVHDDDSDHACERLCITAMMHHLYRTRRSCAFLSGVLTDDTVALWDRVADRRQYWLRMRASSPTL